MFFSFNFWGDGSSETSPVAANDNGILDMSNPGSSNLILFLMLLEDL